MSYTPGPWNIYPQPVTDRDDAKRELAMLVDGTPEFVPVLYMLEAGGYAPAITGCGPSSAANARLIASAPDMLELLENVKFWLERYGKEMPDGAAEMHAGVSWVIGKAKGESV